MNIGKVVIHRLQTGVPGLDEVLGGGIPEFSFNLIAGQPGSGKTTLAHQMMFALATPERPALYFTVLGEPPIKMLRYQQQFDFFSLDKVNRAIRFINLSEETAGGDLDKVMARILAEVQARNPGLVFIDSFRAVVLAGLHPDGDLRLRHPAQRARSEETRHRRQRSRACELTASTYTETLHAHLRLSLRHLRAVLSSSFGRHRTPPALERSTV